jgi:hypothetical protein
LKRFSIQGVAMIKNTRAFLLFLAVAAPLSALADDDSRSFLRFKGGIGVIPVSSGVDPATPPDPNKNGNVNRNIVRGVQPPGQIWVIEDLRAEVKADGSIRVDGRGLLLGGGNSIGGNAGQSVRATLICEATAPFTLHDTNLVPLEADGDFRIDDSLNPPPPAVCASPVLLIRNPGGAWFAAGIPKR